YSILNPQTYIKSNINGFLNILEGCRNNDVKHLIFASSSSVYGLNQNVPFDEDSNTNHPKSLYAATKKSNELMAHAYADLYKLPVTGLRFFTVYGPWGRPDMALFLFARAIFSEKKIDIYNNGNMKRDFTYIDDICEAIIKLSFKPAAGSKNFHYKKPESGISPAPYKLFNIGNSHPVSLKTYIKYLEETIGKKAKVNLMPMQLGDVKYTHSNTSALENYIDFKPNTNVKEGIKKFILWYKSYYNV
ncbi:NAD-dependent epimerase/dehydratase family protein, partial [Alphaproteobacteria bacterium]|nr:NAD-dependent epimerase/dehydratase family protein [Alphaproteobacteria bacterium]